MLNGPRIDMHAHYYGGPLPEWLRARTVGPCLRQAPGGGEEMVAMNGAFPFTPAYFDTAVGLAQMAETGLTHRLLTFPGALGLDVVDDGATGIAAFNDHLAHLGRATEGRLIGLAGLPLARPEAAIAEVRRIRRDLRLPGVILPANYFDTVERARELAPLLAAANESGCHILIHPGLRAGEPPATLAPDHPQFRTSAVTLQSQASQTVLTLVLSDILDAFPRLSFQVVNLGGTIPFVLERIEAIARHRDAAAFPSDRLRRIWYDSASLGPRALELAVAVYGAERVMLGSDWPIFRDDPLADTLARARVSPDEAAMVAGGTARALLDRLSDPGSG